MINESDVLGAGILIILAIIIIRDLNLGIL